MYKAIDIANFFIDLSSYDEDNDMTNMKVNKMIYFAQGWSLAILGKPLFDEPIEAWEHGPVVKSVYQTFKSYGKNCITQVFDEYNENIFDDEITQFLMDVFREYNKYSASGLRKMTHEKGGPWSTVYISRLNRTIPEEFMTEYFSRQDTLPCFDMKKATADIPIVGYYDKDGHLVLPKELDDGDYEI